MKDLIAIALLLAVTCLGFAPACLKSSHEAARAAGGLLVWFGVVFLVAALTQAVAAYYVSRRERLDDEAFHARMKRRRWESGADHHARRLL